MHKNAKITKSAACSGSIQARPQPPKAAAALDFLRREWLPPAQIHHEEQDPENTTRAAALVETLTEVVEIEEQTNLETEDNNMEVNNMENNIQDEGVRLRNNNERIIRTARRNLLSVMDDLEVDLLQSNE